MIDNFSRKVLGSRAEGGVCEAGGGILKNRICGALIGKPVGFGGGGDAVLAASSWTGCEARMDAGRRVCIVRDSPD